MDAEQSRLTQQMRGLVSKSSLGSSRVVQVRRRTPVAVRSQVLKASKTLKRDSPRTGT